MGDEGDGQHVTSRKRELEKRRRQVLQGRFEELERCVYVSSRKSKGMREKGGAWSSGGGLVEIEDPELKRRKWDKEVILVDAIRHIQRQDEFLDEMQEKVEGSRRELDDAQSERLELRNDKQFLRNELDSVREECKQLRSHNVALWQFWRSKQGDLAVSKMPTMEVVDKSLLDMFRSPGVVVAGPDANPQSDALSDSKEPPMLASTMTEHCQDLADVFPVGIQDDAVAFF